MMEPERVEAVWGLGPYGVWSRRCRAGGVGSGTRIGYRNPEPYGLN